MTPQELEAYDAMTCSREFWMHKSLDLKQASENQASIIADLTAHLHDAIAILGWSKPDWQRTIERAKGEVK